MRKILFLLIVGGFFIGFMLLPELAKGQGSKPPPPMLPAEPAQSPIDGGLAVLAAAGGAYAIKKLRDKKK
jgi:hypothetical protein